jgi:hypothetical protein
MVLPTCAKFLSQIEQGHFVGCPLLSMTPDVTFVICKGLMLN